MRCFFFIDKLRPSLDIQSDSIRAKVFCMLLLFLTPHCYLLGHIFTSLSLSLYKYIYMLPSTLTLRQRMTTERLKSRLLYP